MSRLSCVSSDLKLSALFRKAQHTFWIALALAVGLHGLLSQAEGFRTKERLAKPLTTQFIKRQPRLTKPLEMKKEPKPRRRRIKRSMVSVKPRGVPQKGSQFGRLPGLVPILARPDVSLSRVGHSLALGIEPEVAAQQIAGIREDENVVDMCLEMLDVEALDYGRYQAMVIQDPTDKRNIRGFVHLSPFFLSGELVVPPVFVSSGHIDVGHEVVRLHVALRVRVHAGLVRWLNEITGIKASLADRLVFDSGELFDMPWVCVHVPYYLPAYSELEKENVGRYMLSGGFVFQHNYYLTGLLDDAEHPSDRFVREALASQGHRFGRQWTFERLGNEHGICHSFFDFDGGPPQIRTLEPPYCKFVSLDGRVVCLRDNQCYAVDWEYGTRVVGFKSRMSVRFTVNTIIFALTQEGSIAHRVMDSFRGF